MASIVARHDNLTINGDGDVTATLVGTGTNRLIVVLGATRGTGAGGINTCDIGATAATEITNLVATNDHKSALGIAIFTDAQHPGAGSTAFTIDWSGGSHSGVVIYELEGAPQATPFFTSYTTLIQSEITNGSVHTQNVAGEAGKLALAFLAMGDGSFFDTSVAASGNLANAQDSNLLYTHLHTADTTIADADEDYSFTVTLNSGGTPDQGIVGALVFDDPPVPDTTAPTFTVAPAVSSITGSGGTATATIDETGDIYYVVVADAATAPTPAEVIAGQESGGGAPLASGNATATTSISSAFSGLSASTAYDAYFVARDDEGTPNVQASVTKVDFTTTAPQFGITSITSGAIYTGDSVTIGLENANATGKTLTIEGQAITADSQNATQIVFTVPDPKTFGNQRLDYNNPLTIQVTDGGNSDTVDFQIAPDIGHYYATIAEVAGIFADDTGVVVGDKAYGYWQAGSGSVALAYGGVSAPSGGTFRYWIYDISDNGGTWGGFADEVFTDSVIPVITLIGAATVDINEGDVWSDPGYTATDNVDGDITGSVVVGGDTVDPNTIGSYVITYNVSDSEGNAAVQVTRTVNVLDVTAPTITLLGVNPVTHAHGAPYVDAGYTASDANDGDISGNVTVTGSVNTNVTGQYILSFNVSDAAGNAAPTVFRTVNVIDQEEPTITLLGANPLNIDLGSTFTDPGYTATDANDGDLTGSVVVTGAVNPSIAGSYTRRYNVSDAAGNQAIELTRTVNVVADSQAPVITLVGGAVNLDEGDTFTDPGYSATDNVDGDLTSSVIVGGSVDTDTPGIYLLTYDVTDSSGNAAAQRNRLVTVSGTVVTPPVQSSDSWKIQLVQPGATYADPALTGILDSQSQDVSGTAVWDGEAVDTQAALNTRINVTTTNGVIEDAAAGQVSFTPDGSLPRGRYQYEAKGLDANGDPVTFSIGTYTVS